jgi:3-phosphoshikimate 1-carboxyvinyltransferase
MSLPEIIEIVPLNRAVQANLTIPGSKSLTNRALILAALANNQTRLRGALWSEDTQVMVESLKRLGFDLRVEADPEEPCNRTISIVGCEGTIAHGGSSDKPLRLFVGNAGTAARFLTALVCLGAGVYELDGVPRMRERPQAALFQALRQLGYDLQSINDRLPVRVGGGGAKRASCLVSIDESSQFASALLLCAKAGGWDVQVAGNNAEETPYVDMTRQLVSSFPLNGGECAIEPDASSGSYFVAADFLLNRGDSAAGLADKRMPTAEFRTSARDSIRIQDWPKSTWQVDARLPQYLPLPEEISRIRDLGDSILTAAILAPFAERAVRFTDLGRLRVQECERVQALRVELGKCGAQVIEEGDTLTIFPSQLHGAAIETYNDHRIAMAFGILGLKVAGIRINNPACVKKTFPNFFQKLAAKPPSGLGVEVFDPRSGSPVAWEDLFAD